MLSIFTRSERPIDRPYNHGPVNNVLAWFLFFTSALAVLTRLGTRWAIARKLGKDDGMILGALVFSLAQTITTSLEVVHGLGRHTDTLSSSDLAAYQKGAYAADIFFLMSQCLAKLSLVLFIKLISPLPRNVRLSLAVGGVAIVWAATSILLVLFQCHVPETWNFISNSKSCVDRNAMWNFINIFNMLVDVALVCLPITIMWNLRVHSTQKVIVMACFAARSFDIAAIITQTALSNKAKNTTDPTFDFWPVALTMSTVQSLGIVTACIPYLKPFLESLQTGMHRVDDIRRRGGETFQSTYKSAKSKNGSSGNKGSRRSVIEGRNIELELSSLGPKSLDTHAQSMGLKSVVVISTDRDGKEKRDSDESQSSRANIIKQTMTWGVSSDLEGEGSARSE